MYYIWPEVNLLTEVVNSGSAPTHDTIYDLLSCEMKNRLNFLHMKTETFWDDSILHSRFDTIHIQCIRTCTLLSFCSYTYYRMYDIYFIEYDDCTTISKLKHWEMVQYMRCRCLYNAGAHSLYYIVHMVGWSTTSINLFIFIYIFTSALCTLISMQPQVVCVS